LKSLAGSGILALRRMMPTFEDDPDYRIWNPDQLRLPKVSYPLDLNDSLCQRVIAVGDVHGCLDELVELMDRLAPGPADLVVFLGDFIDRGPKSAAVVSYVKYLCEHRDDTFAVLGNHDEKLVRHRRHEVSKRLNHAYVNPMKVDAERAEEYEAVTDAEVLWLSRLPAAIYTVGKRERILTHAGVLAPPVGTHWQEAMVQPMNGLIRNRYVRRGPDERLRPVPCVRGSDGRMMQPPDSQIWDEHWRSPRVIYGHAVHSQEAPRVNNDCYGIDLGCCFGGKLCAYVEDVATGAVRYETVQGRQAYATQDGGDVE
jgi:hypothetical protein